MDILQNWLQWAKQNKILFFCFREGQQGQCCDCIGVCKKKMEGSVPPITAQYNSNQSPSTESDQTSEVESEVRHETKPPRLLVKK